MFNFFKKQQPEEPKRECYEYEDFLEHVIVDYDATNKIISAKFKPGSPFNRINVYHFYPHLKDQFTLREDLVFHQFFIEFFNDINGKMFITLEDGWDFSEDTKKILNGYWVLGEFKF